MKLKYFHDVKNALEFAYHQFVADLEQRNTAQKDAVTRYKGMDMLDDIKSIKELIIQAAETRKKCEHIEQRLVHYWELHEALVESVRKIEIMGYGDTKVEKQLDLIEKLYGK